jgi:hypothetical protein
MEREKPMTPEELQNMLDLAIHMASGRFKYEIKNLSQEDWGGKIAKIVSEKLSRGGVVDVRGQHEHDFPLGVLASIYMPSDNAPSYEIPQAYFSLVFRPLLYLKDFTVDYPYVEATLIILLDMYCYFDDIFNFIAELFHFEVVIKKALDVESSDAKRLARKLADGIRKRVLSSIPEPYKRQAHMWHYLKINAVYKILSPSGRELSLQKVRLKDADSLSPKRLVDKIDSYMDFYKEITDQLKKVENEIREFEGKIEGLRGKFRGTENSSKEAMEQFNRHIARGYVVKMAYEFLLEYIKKVLISLEPYSKEVTRNFVNDVLLDKNIINALFEKAGVWEEVTKKTGLK